MSYTISITGNTSLLRCSIFPPLHLRSDKQWEAALLDFTTYNSIPNVVQDVNNRFYYVKDSTKNEFTYVNIPTGSYEIDDINNRLKLELGKTNVNLKANNNLLRSELFCKYPVDFSREYSIGSLLGFSTSLEVLPPNQWHMSDNTVNIVNVDIINVSCNIVNGAYVNGVDGHIIHSFYPTVPPGFKIIEKPHNLVYLPVNVSLISDIVLAITQQEGEAIDFRGENITARIHIRSV